MIYTIKNNDSVDNIIREFERECDSINTEYLNEFNVKEKLLKIIDTAFQSLMGVIRKIKLSIQRILATKKSEKIKQKIKAGKDKKSAQNEAALSKGFEKFKYWNYNESKIFAYVTNLLTRTDDTPEEEIRNAAKEKFMMYSPNASEEFIWEEEIGPLTDDELVKFVEEQDKKIFDTTMLVDKTERFCKNDYKSKISMIHKMGERRKWSEEDINEEIKEAAERYKTVQLVLFQAAKDTMRIYGHNLENVYYYHDYGRNKDITRMKY